MEDKRLENTLATGIADYLREPPLPPDTTLPDPLQDRPPITRSTPVQGGGQLGRSKPLDQLDTAVKRLSAVEEAVAALGQRLIGSALNARKERKPFQGGATNVSARISSNNDDINLYCERILATIKAVDEILG